MPSSSVMKAYSLFQQRIQVHSNQSTCHSCYAAYAPGAIKYGLSNMGKCRSMGNTMGKYTKYMIKSLIHPYIFYTTVVLQCEKDAGIRLYPLFLVSVILLGCHPCIFYTTVALQCEKDPGMELCIHLYPPFLVCVIFLACHPYIYFQIFLFLYVCVGCLSLHLAWHLVLSSQHWSFFLHPWM